MIRVLALSTVVVLAIASCGGSNGGAAHQARPAAPSLAPPPVSGGPSTIAASRDGSGATSSSTPASSTTAGPPDTVAAAPASPAPRTRSGANVNGRDPAGEPLSISIPAIRLESALTPSGTLADGTIAVPPDPTVAGWFTGGPRPGDPGPAVIMGHVDSKQGIGVFWYLRELVIGDVATVRTTTGDVSFVVTAMEQISKEEFPTERVYGPVPGAALRLITCGGTFDRASGHYRDNLVVYLSQVSQVSQGIGG